MRREHVTMIALALLCAIAIGALMARGQDRQIDPREPPERPPEERVNLPTPVTYDRVASYGCHIKRGEVYRVEYRTGTNKPVKLYNFWELTLEMRGKDEKVIWSFGPVQLDSRESARRDCNDWLDVTEWRITASAEARRKK